MGRLTSLIIASLVTLLVSGCESITGERIDTEEELLLAPILFFTPEYYLAPVVWAIRLTTEELGIGHPPPGESPAREYFLGFRTMIFDNRKLYRKEEKTHIIYGVDDKDGGSSILTIDKSTNTKTYTSYDSKHIRRPIPRESLEFLNKYAF